MYYYMNVKLFMTEYLINQTKQTFIYVLNLFSFDLCDVSNDSPCFQPFTSIPNTFSFSLSSFGHSFITIWYHECFHGWRKNIEAHTNVVILNGAPAPALAKSSGWEWKRILRNIFKNIVIAYWSLLCLALRFISVNLRLLVWEWFFGYYYFWIFRCRFIFIGVYADWIGFGVWWGFRIFQYLSNECISHLSLNPSVFLFVVFDTHTVHCSHYATTKKNSYRL